MAFTPNSLERTTTDGLFGFQFGRKFNAVFRSQLELVTSCLSTLERNFGNGTIGKGVSCDDKRDLTWCTKILEHLKFPIEGDAKLQWLYNSLRKSIVELQYKHRMYLDGYIKVKVLNEASNEIDTINISLKKSIWGQVEEKYASSEWESLWYVNGFGKMFNGCDSNARSNLRLCEEFDDKVMHKIREAIDIFDEDFDDVHLELKIRPEQPDIKNDYLVMQKRDAL